MVAGALGDHILYVILKLERRKNQGSVTTQLHSTVATHAQDIQQM